VFGFFGWIQKRATGRWHDAISAEA